MRFLPTIEQARLASDDRILIAIVRSKQDECTLHFANAGFAFADQRLQRGPLIRRQLHEVLLQGLFLAPRLVMEESTTPLNQWNPALVEIERDGWRADHPPRS